MNRREMLQAVSAIGIGASISSVASADENDDKALADLMQSLRKNDLSMLKKQYPKGNLIKTDLSRFDDAFEKGSHKAKYEIMEVKDEDGKTLARYPRFYCKANKVFNSIGISSDSIYFQVVNTFNVPISWRCFPNGELFTEYCPHPKWPSDGMLYHGTTVGPTSAYQIIPVCRPLGFWTICGETQFAYANGVGEWGFAVNDYGSAYANHVGGFYVDILG